LSWNFVSFQVGVEPETVGHCTGSCDCQTNLKVPLGLTDKDDDRDPLATCSADFVTMHHLKSVWLNRPLFRAWSLSSDFAELLSLLF